MPCKNYFMTHISLNKTPLDANDHPTIRGLCLKNFIKTNPINQ